MPPVEAEIVRHDTSASGLGLGADVLRSLRSEHGVRSLLCEGGPALFDAMLTGDYVDELFLTLAPALVGGERAGDHPGPRAGRSGAPAVDLDPRISRATYFCAIHGADPVSLALATPSMREAFAGIGAAVPGAGPAGRASRRRRPPRSDDQRTAAGAGRLGASGTVPRSCRSTCSGEEREVAEPGNAADCDLIVAIGGDGTMLAAIRSALAADRPVLGLACGSLGVLTAIEADGLGEALDRFSRGDWRPRRLPRAGDRPRRRRLRSARRSTTLRSSAPGIGQVRVTTSVDGTLFSRLAGDGCIVSTPLGSSAYALAAGGALQDPGNRRVPAHAAAHPRRLAGAARHRRRVGAAAGGHAGHRRGPPGGGRTDRPEWTRRP